MFNTDGDRTTNGAVSDDMLNYILRQQWRLGQVHLVLFGEKSAPLRMIPSLIVRKIGLAAGVSQ